MRLLDTPTRRTGLLILLVLCAQLGCTSRDPEWPRLARDYSLNVSGYDVPMPTRVPYEGTEDRHEYLSFYHAGYLRAVNEPEAWVSMNISPRSPRPQAAVDGWNDGYAEGSRVKRDYWRERGVEPFAEHRVAAPTTAPCASSHQPRSQQSTDVLIDQLRELRVRGPTFNGRWRAVHPNEVTTELVARGPKVVPVLLRELDGCGWDEAVYIVLVLRQLHAAEATPRLERLRTEVEEGRFEPAPDMTLDAQLDMFFAASKPGK